MSIKAVKTHRHRFLIESGANAEETDNSGCTPLHCAAGKNPNIEVVKYFVEIGTNINVKTEDGFTPLHLTAWDRHVEFVKVLVEHGADVDATDERGSTAFHYAAVNPNVEVVKYLVEHGVNIHKKDYAGKTPLHFAAIRNYVVYRLSKILNRIEQWFGLCHELARENLKIYAWGIGHCLSWQDGSKALVEKCEAIFGKDPTSPAVVGR